MKVLLVILPLAFALASANGNTTTSSSDEYLPENIITNGYAAGDGKIPYIVSLILGTDDSSSVAVCGGTIIANNWVLTAAHCLTTDYVDIHYGSDQRGSGQFKHRVRSNNFIRHNLWLNSNGNDIGLIRTPRVRFTSKVNRVKLPKSKQQVGDSLENQWAVTCGWGVQANGQMANRLQCVDLEIMTNEECSKSYSVLPNGILCGRSTDGKSTCAGDSGGPLVTRNDRTLVGVVSFFSGAGCMAGDPVGFTRVTAHLDWIRQNSGVVYY
ncbi:serine protease 1-like [Drosophila hydei]|uniref:Serine protease 1-like n=1 Tax=Drosophila hydei TaxID=7224 RepID=A0A6J1MJH7_DROHY|nr:serine protease 1-like [Drosophila hydei]